MAPGATTGPSDATAAWPISVKGVLGPPGSVVLLRNERAEWELPGGRLEEADESLRSCLRREIEEELDLRVTVQPVPLSGWIYEPLPGRRVVIVSFACSIDGTWPETLTHSDEHSAVRVVSVDQLHHLELPQGYRRDIELAVGPDLRG